MENTKKFMIIDGNALVHRAFHALPPLSTKDGVLVNAVYGFTTVLMKALKELKPEYAAVAFDLKGGTFRNELYKEYKAQRIKQPQELYDQIPLIKEVVCAFGIPVVEKQGFEADDVIATLSHGTWNMEHGTVETIIVTGDMDALQLVDAHTKVYSFRKGFSDTVIYDEAAVKERYGITPAQMIDYKALRGDPSDNIPGVKGIGEKTATELLQRFGTLVEVYKKVDTISGRVGELLKKYKNDAMLGKKLVTLVRDVDIGVSLEDCKVPVADNKKLREIFEKFGFKNLAARLDEVEKKQQGSLLTPPLTPPRKGGETKTISSPARGEVRRGGSEVFVITPQGTFGHDLKAILRVTTCELQTPVFDTMIASYLLNPGSRVHDFESIARERNSAADISTLAPLLKKELANEGLWHVFSEIEMPLIPVLTEMERIGIKVDAPYLTKLSKEFVRELEVLTKKIHGHAGQEFNISSPLQLREILFEKMKLAPTAGRIKKTAKGGVASTAAGELEKLRGTHPIVDLIFEYRELAKLQSTYTDALVDLVDKKDGRVHTTFNQAVTATGRLSSSAPNLQNIPIRTENGRMIRKAFVAEKGFVFLSADYSQIELRVAASLSGDPQMIKAFKSDYDFHAQTAGLVFGVAPDAVTPEMRRRAKAINFGIIYGMGATSLAKATNTSRAEAEKFIAKYFEVFHVLHDYLEGLKENARTKGFVETLFGRRRYLPEITSGVQQVRAAAERMAVNMPVQGTAADIIKMAMVAVHDSITAEQHNNTVRMLLQVHDELVFEITEDLIATVSPKIQSIMGSVHELKVPIIVDLKQGSNWGEMKRLI